MSKAVGREMQTGSSHILRSEELPVLGEGEQRVEPFLVEFARLVVRQGRIHSTERSVMFDAIRAVVIEISEGEETIFARLLIG